MDHFIAIGLAQPDGVQKQLAPILNVLAWLATAAGVAGLLIVGTRMALSLRRGEGDEHLSQLGMVLGACVIAASAGPIVQFLPLKMLGDIF